jgi:error-prone DNA polymerase
LQDAKRKGIRVLPVDVRYSDWDCGLEFADGDTRGKPAIRLGLRLVSGFSQDVAERIASARAPRPFADVADLCHRASVDRRHQALLAESGALKGLSGHRHRARWAIAGVPQTAEPDLAIPLPSVGEDMAADYASIGLTLGKHPLSLIRKQLTARRCLSSADLAKVPHGKRVRFAGLVRMRQRPETASGVTFVTLEDEHGMVNAVVWKRTAEEQRRELLESSLMAIDGRWERVDGVQHLIVQRMHDFRSLLAHLRTASRDFH